jgi:hypothetical protein
LKNHLQRYLSDSKQRSARRKSFWHLPRVLLSFIFLLLIWYLLFFGMWQVHVLVYPEHVGQVGRFWCEEAGTATFISSFLFLMPLFLPALGLAFILTNFIFFLIPPARKAFENEAGHDKEMTFAGATGRLAAVFVKYLLPIGIGLSLLGALTLSHLQ